MDSVPNMELSCLTEDINVRTQKPLENTDLGMRDNSGIDKALQTINGELVVINTYKLTETDRSIK